MKIQSVAFAGFAAGSMALASYAAVQELSDTQAPLGAILPIKTLTEPVVALKSCHRLCERFNWQDGTQGCLGV